MKIELLLLGFVVVIGWGLQVVGAGKDEALSGRAPGKQKITTFLWFDRNAEDAVRFDVSKLDIAKLKEAYDHR